MAIDAIDNAVMAKLQGDATLAGLAPGKVWYKYAPEGAVDIGRFVIVSLQIELPTFEQNRTAVLVARYQMEAVDRSTTKTAAQAVLDRIEALLINQPLTIVGHVHMDTKRVERDSDVERDGPLVWQHRYADYEVSAAPV